MRVISLHRRKPEKRISQLTIEFYEELAEEFVTLITEGELDLLKRLDKRNAKEANDEERDFYEAHNNELSRDRRLKARWDRYVFGAPIECTDFCIGIIRALGKLFEQAGSIYGNKKIYIEATKRNKRGWVAESISQDNFLCAAI